MNNNPHTDHTSLFTTLDLGLFKDGKHYRLYDKLGAHLLDGTNARGVYFAIWAPNAKQVSVIGDFNDWNRTANPMWQRPDDSGIWELFIPDRTEGACYKYYIKGYNGYEVEKGDPYAYAWEKPPHTASRVAHLGYTWHDDLWLEQQKHTDIFTVPLKIYEMHIGSWKRHEHDAKSFLGYRELASELPAYCKELGFSHVEFMPVMEHPFYGSWGYQVVGYFAPSSRYGSPQDFMYLVDTLHQHDIGVIIDWVPSHFPTDEHGLGYFDGTHLYEHADQKKGFHPDWKSSIFNFGRNEVRSFLISNALFWIEKYHIDGLRVDAVASMLYLDYSRAEGQWIPNKYGGRENLEAIQFLQELNEAIHLYHPRVFTIAEESTAWPGVTAPVQVGGLGFDFKWMMGWMHDTLAYFQKDPIYRSHHQGQLTFSMVYAYSEKFILPLSHDEVVYGKGSLLQKMPGDRWQQFANLRLLYAFMYGHPGGKMIFMGNEYGQLQEWKHDESLSWNERDQTTSEGLLRFMQDLNQLYQTEPAMHVHNYDSAGFEWNAIDDTVNCVISWIRKGDNEGENLLFVANFIPLTKKNYRIGVPKKGFYTEILNSDNLKYNGSDVLNDATIETAPIPFHGRTHSLSLILPPLAVIVLKYQYDELDDRHGGLDSKI